MRIAAPFQPNRKIALRTEKTSKDDQVTEFVCTDRAHRGLVKDVRVCLTNDDRKRDYQDNPNPIAGHCYVASEIIYSKLGGKEAGWTPQTIQHEGGPHWYLKHKCGTIIDPTADQFETPVPYENGRGCGFLTHDPSKRSQNVMARMDLLA